LFDSITEATVIAIVVSGVADSSCSGASGTFNYTGII
jgi:hypothetical protein